MLRRHLVQLNSALCSVTSFAGFLLSDFILRRSSAFVHPSCGVTCGDGELKRG